MGYVDLKTVPSGLTDGKHAAVFQHGPQTFIELDGVVINAVKAIKLEDIEKIAALLQSYQDDLVKTLKRYPALYTLLLLEGKKLPAAILARLGITASQATNVALILLAIEVVVLVARAVEINHLHEHSVQGGVIIELIFPSVQIQSVVYPRGGFTSKPAVEKAGAAANSAKAQLAGVAATVKGKLGSLSH